ncbi:hypothetical protein K6959_04200 [Bacillus aquiflavi]|uniref:hypothetical protein n=1 Tax=Bacillus aquiflavi TaxID=2672567 RepID=UPI001CA9E8A8|nr:hypothetical protein [Bacillus aquiflavi]UAC49106.1 hypothetical protein K6959_04200 [Bacillus aquiflavi]
MKKRKPIKGSQFPTLAPTPTPPPLDQNDLAPECIRVDKVYDWVFFANRYENKNFIPDEACGQAVSAALAAGDTVTVECNPSRPEDVICNVTILENGNPGRVLIVWTVSVTVTILINGKPVCTFTVRTQFRDEIMLCVPKGITADNVNCRVTEVICETNGGVLMGPDPFGPMVPVRVTLCKDVQVEFPVKLEVLAKFCFPRPNNIPVPEAPMQCDLNLLEFPPQCPDISPPNNCECQATALARNADTLATFGTDGTIVTGTSDLRAEICQECALADSTFTYSFTDTEFTDPTPTPTQPDFSFTFDPTTIDRVVCGEGSLTAIGQGTRFFDGTAEQLFYELTIDEADAFQLILRNTSNVVVFDSGLVTEGVLTNFDECDTFADLLGE